MRYGVKIVMGVLFFSFVMVSSSFCKEASKDSGRVEEISIVQLVDNYKRGTDLQKAGIVDKYLGKKIVLTGKVSDVSDENTFDVVNDDESRYYKVVTDVKNTAAGNPYKAVLIYKNIKKAEKVNKGQEITFSGNIIKVKDERLYLSVWLSADELTEHERELFK